MQYPNKFISNSNFASTPAPLEGAKKIDLTTPANVSVDAFELVEFQEQVLFENGFDAVEYIITCDEYPDVHIVNGSYVEYGATDLLVSIDIQNSAVILCAVFTNRWSATFPDVRHFHAVVIPIKTPYETT